MYSVREEVIIFTNTLIVRHVNNVVTMPYAGKDISPTAAVVPGVSTGPGGGSGV